mgnify:CR=1 FL=1
MRTFYYSNDHHAQNIDQWTNTIQSKKKTISIKNKNMLLFK